MSQPHNRTIAGAPLRVSDALPPRPGYATAACRELISHGFGSLALHRITIGAATGNRPSRAIPERLGFHFEGIEREAQLRHGTFFDLARYSMLSHEWAP